MIEPGATVLVLGEAQQTGLTVIRSLARAGIRVDLGWCGPRQPERRSRYVSRYYSLPHHSPDSDQWLRALDELVEQRRYSLVLPISEPAVVVLQSRRKELPLACHLLGEYAYRITGDKRETYRWAKSRGIPTPPTRIVTALSSPEELIRELGLPLFLKPPRSFTLMNRHRHAVWKLSRADEVGERLSSLSPDEELLAQGQVLGTGVGLEVLAFEGQVLHAFQHRRLRFDPARGSTYRVGEPVESGLLTQVRTFLQDLDYTGVAMFEFIRLPTGEYRLLEVNNRFWGSLPLAVHSGADFPLFLYQMLVEGRRRFTEPNRTGIRCRHLVNDLRWVARSLKRDGWRGQLKADELARMLRFRERFDLLQRDDPWPGLLALGDFLAEQVRELFANPNRSPTRPTPPLTARSVLFISDQGRCRAPFAAHYSSLNSELHFRSAGLWPGSGRTTPWAVAEAARDFGLDLHDHRSADLEEELARAELVCCFNQVDTRNFLERYPSWRSKTVQLGEFKEMSRFTLTENRSAMARLVSRLEQLARGLTGEAP